MSLVWWRGLVFTIVISVQRIGSQLDGMVAMVNWFIAVGTVDNILRQQVTPKPGNLGLAPIYICPLAKHTQTQTHTHTIFECDQSLELAIMFTVWLGPARSLLL